MNINNILSLFDGISCLQVALNRANIKYNSYYASEIDKNSIKITQFNWPNTIQLGDVRDVKSENLPKIGLLTGGFCCQSFSFMGKQLNFTDPRGKLFFECVRLLNELKPKYFLFENVRMKKEYQDFISQQLGVEPIFINSKLLSCQSRGRLYWTNIPNITQPEDKNLTFKNIIDSNEKDYEYWSEHKMNKYHNKEYVRRDTYRFLTGNSKVPCLTVRCGHGTSDEPKTFHNNILRKLTPLEWELAQTLDPGYTSCLPSKNIRRAAIGNGWTVDVISHILSFIPRC